MNNTCEVYAAARDLEGNRKRITGSNHQSEAAARFLLPAVRSRRGRRYPTMIWLPT